jgi:hypothetical protein
MKNNNLLENIVNSTKALGVAGAIIMAPQTSEGALMIEFPIENGTQITATTRNDLAQYGISTDLNSYIGKYLNIFELTLGPTDGNGYAITFPLASSTDNNYNGTGYLLQRKLGNSDITGEWSSPSISSIENGQFQYTINLTGDYEDPFNVLSSGNPLRVVTVSNTDPKQSQWFNADYEVGTPGFGLEDKIGNMFSRPSSISVVPEANGGLIVGGCLLGFAAYSLLNNFYSGKKNKETMSITTSPIETKAK